MRKIHKPSGCIIETAIIYYEEICKYGAGVILINPAGMQTNRMAPTPHFYDSEDEADKKSFEIGKGLLTDHLSGNEILYFDQRPAN